MALFRTNHGVFVPASKVSKVGKGSTLNLAASEPKSPPAPKPVHIGNVDVRHVGSRLTERLSVIEARAAVRVGDRVRVRGLERAQFHVHHTKGGDDMSPGGRGEEAEGVVRYIGRVDFVEDENE